MLNLGPRRGPQLRHLPWRQRRVLDGWLSLALASPLAREDVPIEYTRALGTLAARRGIKFQFADGMRLPAEAPLDKNVPGCVGGTKRRVRVTKPWK